MAETGSIPPLEEDLINAMIKSGGRPIAAVPAATTIGIIDWTVTAAMRAGKAAKEPARG